MGNSLRLKTLASAVSVALVGGVVALPAHTAFAAGLVVDKVANSAQDRQTLAERKVYIIRFAEEGLMHYAGGVNGLAPTAQDGSKRKVDAKSSASVAYLDYLSAQRNAHVDAINAAIGRTISVPHSYAVTMNGIASELSLAEAIKVKSLPGVKSVKAAGEYRTTTFRGPEFIGADTIWNGTNVPGGVGTRGQGVVVGVIDTGSFAAHPSFADDAACGFSAANHKLLSTADCLTSSGGLCTGTTPEANSGNGHGVHTASTAAGNTLTSSAVPPPVIPAPFTQMSGVAPCASLRTYKVCATNNCDGAAIDAAIENAITDGVDVINFSISGGSDPWNDTDRLFLDAVNADIFVAASAGNTRAETPDPVGQVNHLGAWVTTVAASTHDGNVARDGELTITGPGTVPPALQNISLNPGSGPNTGAAATNKPIATSAANPLGCTANGGFPAGFFTGKIALISRGTCTFEEKINNAAAAGADVAVIYNNAAGVINMSVGGASLPAYSILQTEGQAIVAFLAGDSVFADGFDGPVTPPDATADFTPGVKQGDVLAGFSLRGPSALTSVTKPDVTGPGVNIYAAVDAGSGNYGYLSGTSMSSPHTAGAGALLRAAHPTWTNQEVKSALMLTAFTGGHKEDLTTPWDPDDVGSGRIDLTKAAKTGLVMNETYANFLAANPATSGDPKTLNIPSARNLACDNGCDFTRTFRNTLATASNWTASVVNPAELDVTVSPTTFSFAAGNTAATQALTIHGATTSDITVPAFAEVVLHENGGQSPDLHMYVAIAGTAPVGNPNIIDSGQLDLAVPATVDGLYVNWISHATCATNCTGTAFNFDPWLSSGNLSFFWPNNATSNEAGVVSSGTTYAVLASGATIGPASTFTAGTATANTSAWRAGVTNGFLGFKFNCPAGVCFGYAQLTTTSPNGFPMTVNRWWYDNSGAAITIP
ncbi:subtilisin family serine protease [Dokdonella fugitiva]|uniref:Subtilisin family serine protease n=1 Tax=Dokdonella fugitiva TaxID=328517 RepID=A0A839EYT7_9GAMM|nr:S8 family serine peptidase [Dokdonella fugitiva]MBA8889877.1 subtilisin family serine protease [Dokdonella fugitiva]